jgi:hypothetical protein
MVEPMTGVLVRAMAPPRRVRGSRPSKLDDGAIVSRVSAPPTSLIARPDRWPATDLSRQRCRVRLGQLFPFVEQAGVGLADQRAQPGGEVLDGVGAAVAGIEDRSAR